MANIPFASSWGYDVLSLYIYREMYIYSISAGGAPPVIYQIIIPLTYNKYKHLDIGN